MPRSQVDGSLLWAMARAERPGRRCAGASADTPMIMIATVITMMIIGMAMIIVITTMNTGWARISTHS